MARPMKPVLLIAVAVGAIALSTIIIACNPMHANQLPSAVAATMDSVTAADTATYLPMVTREMSTELVQPADFHYLGAFRLPDAGERPLTFAYGGNAMTYYPDGDAGGAADGFPGSLFISGHDRMAYGELPDGDQIAEISIPVPVIATSPESLPQGEFLQPFQDVAAAY
ncbi:MAG: hypothetical protein KC443_22455, partial [Anaerolineales bacterium]|nr:hypothetical protein [Anaerolineales bacterium]